MRTTVTLDDDTVAAVHRLMRERGVSFKKALNDAIREGARHRPAPVRFETTTADLGVPTVNLDKALQTVAELEDEELLRRQRRGA
ncbi:ribbon-helix-helix domain-containing protein [Mycobacterium sp. Y57]|uniref:ribbon-helix-helix domain-containing protein n=1 Tax=Mycolicibacterium xanthum TaxID=2796469 RepID=UPI001C857552|nr:CopG family transcriptional regulator [Mycolicibacterium xanthum]MBX7432651.1 ribbon-helix-helix domain-containing protein [Mycolicibacterium xanthum]